MNNTTNSLTYLTYRRATDMSPCNELVVMDVCVVIGSKGEAPPHSFMKIDKTLNKVGGEPVILALCIFGAMTHAGSLTLTPCNITHYMCEM